MKKALNLLSVIFISFFAFLIILRPEISLKTALSGVILCGNVIIPSLFPFTFCVMFINKSGILKFLKPLNPVTQFLFHLNFYEFSLFLLSLVGGYPLGAKLLSQNGISDEKTKVMINYCINAGPAFVVLAVGKGVFKSTLIGWVLFLSQIISSLIIALFLARFLKRDKKIATPKKLGVVDNFVLSAADAADTIIKICSLVILFSVICGYIEMLSKTLKPFAVLALLCEVTTAVFKSQNILTTAFLLGFAGVSIWCQVLSLLKGIKINFILFIIFRIIHGFLSCGLTLLFLKLFKISISTISNNVSFNISAFINGPVVAFSLIIMGVILIISLYNKKFAGNLYEDVV